MPVAFVPPSLPVAVNDLVPQPDDFAHLSRLHGQGHVARVMVHAFRLLGATRHEDETKRLWASVFLHDLARTHDGVCHRHGEDAWARFETDRRLRDKVAAAGIADDDHPAIATAVGWHAKPTELDRDHPHWRLTALLKDADGLDRVRIHDLDPRYLRFAASRDMVPFAQALFDGTRQLPTGPGHFAQVLDVASRLLPGGAR